MFKKLISHFIIVSIIVLSFFTTACSTNSEFVTENNIDYKVVLQPTGEIAKVVFFNKERSSAKIISVEGELFYIDSNSVYLFKENSSNNKLSSDFKIKGNLYHIKLSEIVIMNLPYFSNDEWVEKVVYLQVVPAVLLGVAAGLHTENPSTGAMISIVMLSPAAITSLFFISSEPDPEIDKNSSMSEINDYRKYSRFPYTMNEDIRRGIFNDYNLIEY